MINVKSLPTQYDVEDVDSELTTSYPDVAKYLTLSPGNVLNKNSTGLNSITSERTYGNHDITYTLCYGKKTWFVRSKNQTAENVLIQFDLVFENLVSIVTIELDLEEGSVDHSYWREGKLNHKPVVLGKNRLTFTVSPGKTIHNFKLSFSARSYGTMYMKKFRLKAIWYKIKPPSKYMKDLQSMVNCEQFSDVWFKIEGERLCASRFILSARSEYFNKLLLGGMKEGNKNEEVNIPSATYAAFSAVIAYLYTGTLQSQLDISTWDLSLQMLRLSHLYLIHDLETELQSFLLCNISEYNANDILLVAYELELKSLKDYAMAYALTNVKHFESLKQQPNLLAEVAQGLALKIPKKLSPKKKTKQIQ